MNPNPAELILDALDALDDQDMAEMQESDIITTDCCGKRIERSKTCLVDNMYNWYSRCWSREFYNEDD